MKIILQGKIWEFNQGTSIKEIANKVSADLAKATVGAIINHNKIVNNNFVVNEDVEIEFVTNRNEVVFDQILNYTAAFITGVAIEQLYGAKIDEIIIKKDEEEFNVTADIQPKIGLADLPTIQAKVNELLKGPSIQTITNGYELNGVKFITDIALMLDLKHLKVIELQQLTGSYQNGDATKLMVQRIHGMVGASNKELTAKKTMMEDRRSRDHRTINKQLKIFGFDPLIGAGLPLWLPNGTIIKEEIKKYIKEKQWQYDYVQVNTPVIGTTSLYKTSGHWEHYKDDMFQPFTGGKGGDEEFMLRPMNCPHHAGVYKQEPRTYKDLPLRIAEHAIQHRFESSGSLTGLERVRAMELTDSHIFVRPDQVSAEFSSIYQMVEEILTTFNIKIDYISLSLRDPADKKKYFNDDAMWNRAEAELEAVLNDLKLDYKKMIGEAAFYGPKLDIQIKTAQNHEITVATIQLDFLLPERFNISYLDAEQNLKRPIAIHCASIGTYERFVAILLEQTKGVLPLWLAPTQIEIIPLNDEASEKYANELKQEFKQEYIRSHVDLRDERLSWKIREAQIHKIPYQLVIGHTECENNTVTFRKYGSEEQITVSRANFLTMIKEQIKAKK